MRRLSMEEQYLDHMAGILHFGTQKSDRTGTGTISLFGHQMRCDLRDGFPLLTTKKVALKAVIVELLWFLRGDTNIKYLQDNGCKIWNEWADINGNLGPVYGKQWRSWYVGTEQVDTAIGPFPVDKTVDQIAEVIERLKTNPDCRRLLVSAWNVADLKDMALMPCHVLFQFYTEEISKLERLGWAEMYLSQEAFREVSNATTDTLPSILDLHGVPKRYLSCQLYQRSADFFLGVPFNIASYALLTMMVAQVTGMVAKDFIHTFGDAHIYTNHCNQVQEQLEREPYHVPTMKIAQRGQTIDDFLLEDFMIEDYDPHPAISAPIAV